MIPMSLRRLTPALLVAVLAVSACGSDAEAPAAASTSTEPLDVVASFYPLQFLAERVGGDRVEVSSLTKPGAEPHDLELAPGDLAGVADADLVVYLSGFQPSVDEAVTGEAAGKAFDAKDSADLSLTYTPIEEGAEATEEAGSTDPHFWLDPTRLRAVGTALAARMAQADPAGKADFEANAAALGTELGALDGELEAGLADCANPDLVTSHNAFGYLADRYGLTQVGITGLTPEAEPAAGEMAAVIDFVKANKVRTIYYETLVSPAVAKVVADGTGAATAVLDPIEGLSDASAGKDYFEVMRANLATLEKGQPCS